MSLDLPGPAGGIRATVGEPVGGAAGPGNPAVAVTALHQEHALGLTRLALVMVRDRQAAEDIVQDAFCGLHRLWPGLRDKDRALPYVRSAVLNGCRSEFRRRRPGRAGRGGYEGYIPPAWSAESEALAGAERREVLQALLRLPARQREALVLRFYLDLSEADTADAMRISRGHGQVDRGPGPGRATKASRGAVMTGSTQERLRDATTALGQAIQPADIPPLRLREPGRRTVPGHVPWLAGRRPAARSWLIPAGAAAAVLAVIGLIFAAGGPGGRSPAAPSARPAGLPRYILTYGNGIRFAPGGGPGYVRDTLTGRVVARIRPAGPRFSVEGVAAAPGDRTFYLIGEETVGGDNSLVHVECFRVLLGANGRPSAPQQLPGAPLLAALPPTSNGAASIPLAVSPDGRELAYAPEALMPAGSSLSGMTSQSVIVQDVATGARRSWSAWPTSDLQISQLSWATGGLLGFAASMAGAVSGGTVVPSSHRDIQVFMILRTTAAGSSLISSSTLVSHGSGTVDLGTAIVSPVQESLGLVLSPDGRSVFGQVVTPLGVTRLVALAAVGGKVTRVLLSGPEAARAAPVGIDGGALLFIIGARDVRAPHGGAPYVSGHLAGLNLATGQVTRLPYPVYTGVAAPAWPMLAAW